MKFFVPLLFHSSLSSLSSAYMMMKLSSSQKKWSSNLHKLPSIQPVGELQNKYCKMLHNASLPVVVVTGSAGTWKTLMACDHFVRGFQSGNITKLVLTRPFVSVDGEDIGFLPGTIQKKMEPWTQPVFDILSRYFSVSQLELMIQNRVVEIVPLGFMRGRTFHDTFIIADEMQNSSPSQMLMLLTRLGERSKIVVTGDLNQSDLHHSSAQNGLADLLSRLTSYPFDDIGHVLLTDVFRSKLVLHVNQLYKK
jgi:phosphate starvation-inducible PhoH-like protein